MYQIQFHKTLLNIETSILMKPQVYLISYIIIRLWIFRQIHIFINTIKGAESTWIFVAPAEYYNAYFAMDILFNFLYYMLPVISYIFEFLINA